MRRRLSSGGQVSVDTLQNLGSTAQLERQNNQGEGRGTAVGAGTREFILMAVNKAQILDNDTIVTSTTEADIAKQGYSIWTAERYNQKCNNYKKQVDGRRYNGTSALQKTLIRVEYVFEVLKPKAEGVQGHNIDIYFVYGTVGD